MLLSSDEKYKVLLGDSIVKMVEDMPQDSVDMSVYSPPFPSLFSYSSESADLGNSEDLRGEAKLHFSFFFRSMLRVMKPGRIMMVHCMQIPGLIRNGENGIFDFRGLLIRLAQRAGFDYQYDWCYTKNPQAQAVRTHSHNLLFVTLERDRIINRGALPDYLIKFQKPGINAVPVDSPGISRNEWIQWAEAAWDWKSLRETDTLNTAEGKSEDHVKHICPLQLPVINRLIKLYSNPNEIVFSPFAGIGSEGYEAIKLGRRFFGIEINPRYHATALLNLKRAAEIAKQNEYTLFDMLEPEEEKAESDMVV